MAVGRLYDLFLIISTIDNPVLYQVSPTQNEHRTNNQL